MSRIFLVRTSKHLRKRIFAMTVLFRRTEACVRPLHSVAGSCIAKYFSPNTIYCGHVRNTTHFERTSFQLMKSAYRPFYKSVTEEEAFIIEGEPGKTPFYLEDTGSNLVQVFDQFESASSCQEIFQIVENTKPLDVKFASQAIFSIHQLLRKSCQCDYNIYRKHVHQVILSPVFHQLLQVLEYHFEELMDDVFMDVFLSLSCLLPSNHPLLMNFFVKCQKLLPSLSLKNLSVFSSIMAKLGDNYIPCIAPVIGFIAPLVEDCSTEEDFGYLAKCLLNGFNFVSLECLKIFAQSLKPYISQGRVLELSTSINCLLLFSSIKEFCDVDLQQVLISLIIGHVPTSSTPKLRQIFHAINKSMCNTDSIFSAVEERTVKLLQQSQSTTETLVLLNCISRKNSSLEHKLFVQNWLLKCPELLADQNQFHVSLLMGTVMNLFPTPNLNLYSQLLNTCFSQPIPPRLLRNIVKDPRISNYCSKNLVLSLVSLCSDLVNSSLKCEDIFVFTSFIIANINNAVPVNLIERLHGIVSQLDIYFLYLLSLSMSMVGNRLHSLSRHVQQSLVDLNRKLLVLCEELLPSLDNMFEYNIVLRTLKNLSLLTKPEIIVRDKMVSDDLFYGYNRFLDFEHFHQNTILSTTKLFRFSRVCMPQVLDLLAHVIVKRESNYPVKTVASFLNLCFHLNYCPETEVFFPKCQDIISRQVQRLTCGEILLAALCLGLFQVLSKQFAQVIFCEAFLEMLEKEIAGMHLGNWYKMVLRRNLATLNKVVCLDYPEYCFPWVHDRFYQSVILESEITKMTHYEKEVFEALCCLLPGKHFIRSKVFTPYFYNISFECLLDENNRPVENLITENNDTSQTMENSKFQRVAIDVIRKTHFCSNVPRLRGNFALKTRHLEILGYKVVQIPYFELESFRGSRRDEIVGYLQNKIFGT